MRSLALISTLLLASWINQSMIAQAHLSWKYARLTAGLDTVGRLSNSAELSRTLYKIAYGSAGKRFPNQLLKTLDSANTTCHRKSLRLVLKPATDRVDEAAAQSSESSLDQPYPI